MRRWEVNLPPVMAIPATVVVEAFSEGEAAEEAVKALGITLVPCCEIGKPACQNCSVDGGGAGRKSRLTG